MGKWTQKGRESFDAFRSEQLETLALILKKLDPSDIKVLNATIENAALILEKTSQETENNKKAGEG